MASAGHSDELLEGLLAGFAEESSVNAFTQTVATRIFDDQRGSPLTRRQRERSRRPSGIQFLPQPVLVLEHPHRPRPRMLRPRHHHED
jgi:hypothetical protein